MVTQKIMLSPCLLFENEQIYDWMLLENTLNFIEQYLDCGLDTVKGSIFHEESWYQPPEFEQSMFNFFATNIIPKLLSLLRKGKSYDISDFEKEKYEINNDDFKIENQKEMDLLMVYTEKINCDYVLFLGKINYHVSREILDISFPERKVCVPLVKEPYMEKSANFNNFIKKKDSENLFVNSDICIKLVEEMKEQEKSMDCSKGSLYKKYGEIIALRNGFSEYFPKNPYNKDTKYFISKNEKNIISIDLLHGSFEVYEGNKRKLWIAEYNFVGEQISPKKMTKNQLNVMRQNHKLES